MHNVHLSIDFNENLVAIFADYEDDDVYEPDPMYAQVRKPKVKRVCIQFRVIYCL